MELNCGSLLSANFPVQIPVNRRIADVRSEQTQDTAP
jgi:hypothetical protein